MNRRFGDPLMEADWKKFRARVPEWRERHLSRRNAEIVALLADEQKTPTERFWEAKARMEQEARILVTCFDGHSRSQLEWSLMLMHGHGVIGAAELEEFSEDLRTNVLRLCSVGRNSSQ